MYHDCLIAVEKEIGLLCVENMDEPSFEIWQPNFHVPLAFTQTFIDRCRFSTPPPSLNSSPFSINMQIPFSTFNIFPNLLWLPPLHQVKYWKLGINCYIVWLFNLGWWWYATATYYYFFILLPGAIGVVFVGLGFIREVVCGFYDPHENGYPIQYYYYITTLPRVHKTMLQILLYYTLLFLLYYYVNMLA